MQLLPRKELMCPAFPTMALSQDRFLLFSAVSMDDFISEAKEEIYPSTPFFFQTCLLLVGISVSVHVFVCESACVSCVYHMCNSMHMPVMRVVIDRLQLCGFCHRLPSFPVLWSSNPSCQACVACIFMNTLCIPRAGITGTPHFYMASWDWIQVLLLERQAVPSPSLSWYGWIWTTSSITYC